jgi:hypothetical protein
VKLCEVGPRGAEIGQVQIRRRLRDTAPLRSVQRLWVQFGGVALTGLELRSGCGGDCRVDRAHQQDAGEQEQETCVRVLEG